MADVEIIAIKLVSVSDITNVKAVRIKDKKTEPESEPKPGSITETTPETIPGPATPEPEKPAKTTTEPTVPAFDLDALEKSLWWSSQR